MIKKIFSFEEKGLDFEDQGIVECIITTSNMDKEYEVLLSEGADYKEFIKTGTVLFDHNQSLPIAKTLSISKNNKNITAKIQFSKTDSFSQKIYNLVKEGIIKGVSVGFEVIKDRIPSKKDIAEYGNNIKRVITNFKIHEFSIVAVPANSDALILSVKKLVADKKIEESDLKLIFPQINIKEEIKKEYLIPITIKKINKNIDKIEDLVQIEIKRLKGKVFYKD